MRRGVLAALIPLALLVSIAGGCGSSGSSGTTATATTSDASTTSEFAAPLALLTFLYVDCPDVCPLISAALRTTVDKLGSAAKQVQVIAISVDPVGDTPKAVRKYLSSRGVLHRFEYLVGTKAQLAPVWAKYHIAAERDATLKREVGHTGIVIGIDAGGKERTYYPSDPLKPSWMVHDVPLLAGMK
jgi:protein SCO1/2